MTDSKRPIVEGYRPSILKKGYQPSQAKPGAGRKPSAPPPAPNTGKKPSNT